MPFKKNPKSGPYRLKILLSLGCVLMGALCCQNKTSSPHALRADSIPPSLSLSPVPSALSLVGWRRDKHTTLFENQKKPRLVLEHWSEVKHKEEGLLLELIFKHTLIAPLELEFQWSRTCEPPYELRQSLTLSPDHPTLYLPISSQMAHSSCPNYQLKVFQDSLVLFESEIEMVFSSPQAHASVFLQVGQSHPTLYPLTPATHGVVHEIAFKRLLEITQEPWTLFYFSHSDFSRSPSSPICQTRAEGKWNYRALPFELLLDENAPHRLKADLNLNALGRLSYLADHHTVFFLSCVAHNGTSHNLSFKWSQAP